MDMKQKAFELVEKTAPVEWESIANKMGANDKCNLVKYLESISERAAELAGYFDERHGYGCGDQGHKNAVKQAMRNGKIVHCNVFGYNRYADFTF